MMISAAFELRFDNASTGDEACLSATFTCSRLLKARTVQIGVSDMHVVDTLAGETGRDLLAFLFQVENEG